MSNAAGRLGTHTRTHTHTNYYNPRVHAPSVNEPKEVRNVDYVINHVNVYI